MKKVAVATIFAISTSTLATAEPYVGSRIDPAPKSVKGQFKRTEADALRVLHMFSRCRADNRKIKAAEIVKMPFRSVEQFEAVKPFFKGDDGCLGYGNVSLKFSIFSFIGGMAEELFLANSGKSDVGSLMRDSTMLKPRNTLEDIALCLIRANPTAARALLDTEPAGPDESTAIRSLIPSLGPCVTEGVSGTFDKPSIRAMVAVAFYLSATYRPEGT